MHRGYDVSPLAQFERNRDTERAYDYMSAAAAWLALRASFTPSVHFDENPWFLRFEVLRHALIHCFSVGSSALMVPASKVERHDGHVGRPAERGRAFFGLDPLLKELSLKDDLEVPPWVFEIREREEERLWGPYIDRWIYFGVPSTYPAQLRYIRTFCSRTKRYCLQPANREMLSQLNSKKYWADEGHLSHAGSKVYTLWLANQLVRTGALKH